jgi:hypothetical protein
MGRAVLVTDVPAQTGFEETLTIMLTGSMLFTVIVIVLPKAGLPVAHCSEEVSIQVT